MTEQHTLTANDLGGSAITSPLSSSRTDPRSWATSLEDDERLDRLATVVDRPARAVGESRAAPTLRGRWLGHPLHPALTDLPIGFWTSAFVLDLVGGRRARPAAQRLIALGLLAVPCTAATGLADYRSIEDPRARRVGAAHAVGNSIVALCYFASWRARRRRRHLRGVLWGLAGGALASATGYLGGHLAFGGDDESDADDRSTSASQPRAASAAPSHATDDGTLLDLDGASAMLGVPVAQVQAMVGEGLLHPVSATAREPQFRDTDVLAVKLLGG